MFQRMYVQKGKFQYEYMGYAEYEFGATMVSRKLLCRAWVENRIARKTITLRDTRLKCDLTVIAFSTEQAFAQLSENRLNVNNKGLLTMTDTVAWLGIGYEQPVLLLRGEEFIPQADMFINEPIDYWREQGVLETELGMLAQTA